MKLNINIKLLIGLLVLLSNASYAQTDFSGYFDDIGRFGSTMGPVGTARNQAIGGANTALGGDMSSMYNNPAGLGLMRKSEFAFSPGFTTSGTSTNYRNENFSGSKGRLNIPQLGIVFANTKDPIEGGKFRGINIGIGVNRTNEYNNTYNFGGYAGRNIVQTPRLDGNGDTARDSDGFNIFNIAFDKVSYIDYLNSIVNDTVFRSNSVRGNGDASFEELLLRQGFNGYLLDTTRDGKIRSFVPLSDMIQSGTITTRGRQNSIDFSFGGNYDDKFFFGGGASISTGSFESVSTLTESWTNVQPIYGQEDPINRRYANSSYTIKQTNAYSVTGINLKAGAIYRINEIVRVGASYQSPTWSNVSQQYTNTLTNNWNNAPYGTGNLNTIIVSNLDEENIPSYVYRLKTPGKLSAGLSIFFKKNGFITFDADYIDYTQGNVSDKRNSSLASQGRKVDRIYQQAVNIRIGGEYRYEKFRVRGGYSYQDSPYKQDFVNQQTTVYNSYANAGITSISGGLGFREEDWYLDLTVVNRQFTNGMLGGHIYTPTLISKVNQTSVVVTLGFPLD
jgi:long-subunit fatty acid transport protein